MSQGLSPLLSIIYIYIETRDKRIGKTYPSRAGSSGKEEKLN
jgi:hypothetical protein